VGNMVTLVEPDGIDKWAKRQGWKVNVDSSLRLAL
jgi:hypothetical protein